MFRVMVKVKVKGKVNVNVKVKVNVKVVAKAAKPCPALPYHANSRSTYNPGKSIT